MKPWVCPKCQRVWGPLVDRCQPCNAAVDLSRGMRYPVLPGTGRRPDAVRWGR